MLNKPSHNRSRRGHSLVIALALILALATLVSASMLQAVSQLKVSRPAREQEHALQMAEAGANAYLNLLSNGAGTGTYASLVTGLNPVGAPTATSAPPDGIISLQEFKQGVLDGTYTLTRYPAGSQQGYYVYELPGSSTAVKKVISYGYSNGLVRRVRVEAMSFSIFDWAAIYGMDPNTGTGSGDTGPAWRFSGAANVVGASGAEGYIDGSNNVTYYDGPIILAGPGSTLNPSSSFNPTVYQSTPNVPSGHTGTGVLASPKIRRLTRTLDIGTADSAANEWAGFLGATTSLGVEYFRANNNNATGLRYLVQDSTGKVRELNDPLRPYTVVDTGSTALSWSVNNAQLVAAGKASDETFLGIRAYPGNYFFESINQQTSDRLYLRTYADGQTGVGSPITVYDYTGNTVNPNNPNPFMASEKNVRFWIGRKLTNPIPNTSFSYQTFMEDSQFASRFRVYSAATGSISVSGTNTNPPPKFRVNLLACNYYTPLTGPNAGQKIYYGDVSIASGTYLFGSLISWKVSVAGGCTIEKQASEGGGQGADRLTYSVTDWTELP